MANVLGVDVGVEGAAVLVDDQERRVLALIDLPIVRFGAHAILDGAVFGSWLVEQAIDYAVVELVQHYRGDPNPTTTAKLIRIAGGVESTLLGAEITIAGHPTPSSWKGRAGLPGKQKDPGGALALALANMRLSWPGALGLSLAKHHNRAEAGLVTLFWRGPDRPAPKPKRRSKAVDKAAAENAPPGTPFGTSPPTLLERFVAEHGGESAFLPVSPKAVALKVGKARLRSLGLAGSARVVRGKGPVGQKKRPAG
jgi:hypothetical protein